MMKYKIIIACLFILFSVFHLTVNAQSATGVVTGTVIDAKTLEILPISTVAIFNAIDSSYVSGVMTNDKGFFTFTLLSLGKYYLKISYVGYDILKTEIFSLTADQPQMNFGNIKLQPSATSLKTVTIQDKEIRVEQKEDTIQYNSNAYKTHPDATTEDLVTKMPGISSDTKGNVTAHGEQVKQVLVDGKPFFGDDPSMALKNLPADVVDKIQIFDKLSDQSQFTGFDDGTSQKTMNIVTRQGRSNGFFGKLYAGYGTDDRYNLGGNLNLFKGNRRISIIGLFNNINQQNFNTQDLLGVLGGGGSGGRPGRGGFGGSSSPTGYSGYIGGAGSNFLIGPQSGISATNSVGLNYTDNWGKKIKVTACYFFNNATNTNSSALTRNYIGSENGLNYFENDSSKNNNYNHRFNLRLEYAIDTLNKIIVTSKLNLQKNNATSAVLDSNILPENIVESRAGNYTISNNSGYTLSNNFLFQHKFKKRGRTISLNLGDDNNSKKGNGSLYSLSQFTIDSILVADTTDQRSNQNTSGYTLSASLNYTEPLDSNSILQFNYSPSYSNNNIDKETNNFDIPQQDYIRDTVLSNKYQSAYISNKGGISYRRNGKKYNFMAGVNFQYATLSGDETFPTAFTADKSFKDLLPQAMFNYKFSTGTNLRIMYRTSTNIPSISQLQTVIDNSNPLLLTTGNYELTQDYEHTLTVRFGKTKSEKATGFFGFLYGNYAMNYIGNSTFIASKDTTLAKGIILTKGSQLTKPVNLNGYWNARSFFTYVVPITKIKCNLNFNAGLTYNRTPALINNVKNMADNYNITGGTGLSSNISENLDFTLSYNANYIIVKNTLQTQSNNNYFYHTATLKFNWIFWKGFVFNTNLTQTLYDGLAQSYNQNYMLWNASFAYKFLKNRTFEIKASVYDVLNQNKSIARNITDTYIEDSRTQVLNRYFMLTATYTIKSFKNVYKTKE